ncbi:GNAT family N-acetyltransferase [Actinokineospora sp. HUAS TT18]|uniref:GNAT family N-acetyltransferase n=1 Tax=Actinokineospora sp. HUAS TT18 TaxID=3447451 RepID=UPI003F51D380
MTLEWRPLTPADQAAWVDLWAEAEAVDKTGEHQGPDEYAETMADADMRSVAAFDGETMVAVASSWFKAGHVEVNQVLMDGTVRPSHRRRGIGRELLGRIVAAAAAQHDERCPELVFGPRSWVHENNEGKAVLFSSAGYEPIRYFFDMRADLADPPAIPLPPGLRPEPFRAEHDDEVRRAHNECFLDHWGSIPSSPEFWRAHMTGNPGFSAERSVLLRDADGRIAAYVLSYSSSAHEAATGQRELWLGQVGTLRPWRGKGVATALLSHVLGTAKAAGYDSAALSVDSGNATGALGVYERSGFAVTCRWTTYSLSR